MKSTTKRAVGQVCMGQGNDFFWIVPLSCTKTRREEPLCICKGVTPLVHPRRLQWGLNGRIYPFEGP
jgi:hypothetical protein